MPIFFTFNSIFLFNIRFIYISFQCPICIQIHFYHIWRQILVDHFLIHLIPIQSFLTSSLMYSHVYSTYTYRKTHIHINYIHIQTSKKYFVSLLIWTWGHTCSIIKLVKKLQIKQETKQTVKKQRQTWAQWHQLSQRELCRV